MGRRLAIRCDAGPATGMGHLTRQADLARTLARRGVECVFFTRAPRQALDLLRSRCPAAVEPLPPDDGRLAQALAEGLGAFKPDGVMIDLLQGDTDPALMAPLRQWGAPVLAVTDDPLPRPIDCDYLFACNPNQRPELYPERGAGGPRLFLGPDYFMAHQAFARRRDPAREQPAAMEKILVIFGGDGGLEAIRLVLAGLALARRRLEVAVVLSPLAPPAAARELKRDFKKHPLSIMAGLGPEEMSRVMAESSLAIGPASNSGYEACLLGTPLAALNLVPRQNQNAAALAGLGACVNLGMFSHVPAAAVALTVEALYNDPDRRRGMAQRGMALFDGRGLDRAAEATAQALGPA